MNQDLLIRNFRTIAFCLLFVGPTAAQGEDIQSTLTDDVATLNLTTVTGEDLRSVIIRQEAVQRSVTPVISSRTPQNEEERSRLLPSVDTISGAEIRTFQRYGIEDILHQSAGLNVVQTGQKGATSSLFIRGMESNHAVVLLNGRRLPPGLAGLYQIEFFDTSTLESVQILKGGASSLYGSDALAGAIDLRSTDARYVENDTISSYVEGGSFETFRTGHKVTLREGPVGIALDASFLDTQNDRLSSAHENGVFRGNVAVELADGVFFDMLGYVQDANLEVPGSSLGAGFPAPQINDNKSGLFSPRLTIQRDDWDFSTFYSYTTNELNASRNLFAGLNNVFEQTGHEFEAVFNFRPTDQATHTIGAGHTQYDFTRMPHVPSVFSPPSAFTHSYNSIFAQTDLELPANFHLLASGRYDDHNDFESKGTYSIQLSHLVEQSGTMIFGKVATGYKAPSGQDFVFLNPAFDPTTLQPEESETWEIGLRQPFLNNTGSIAVTYFQADIENLIDLDPVTFFNPAIVDTETEGIEVELRHAPCDSFSWYLNYTWLDALITKGQYGAGFGGNPGDRLPRRPTHALSAGFVVEGDRWKAGAEISGNYDRFDSPNVFLDDYTFARIFGSVEVNENVEIYGRIENTFDNDYQTTRGFEAAGLGAFGGVRVLIGK
tara:strand:+ start:638 stop:2623 length:1986 start_codon:yes stop_codon:yes gene_type:complete